MPPAMSPPMMAATSRSENSAKGWPPGAVGFGAAYPGGGAYPCGYPGWAYPCGGYLGGAAYPCDGAVGYPGPYPPCGAPDCGEPGPG